MSRDQRTFDCGCTRTVDNGLRNWIVTCGTHMLAATRYNPDPLLTAFNSRYLGRKG